MIDPRRWILVEAWLNLGLRVEWASSYESPGTWQRDDEENCEFFYAGHKTWKVMRNDRAYRPYGPNTVPSLGVETLRHELAHYMAATDEERGKENFAAFNSEERRAIEAEEIIDAMLQASARIAQIALTGEARRG